MEETKNAHAEASKEPCTAQGEGDATAQPKSPTKVDRTSRFTHDGLEEDRKSQGDQEKAGTPEAVKVCAGREEDSTAVTKVARLNKKKKKMLLYANCKSLSFGDDHEAIQGPSQPATRDAALPLQSNQEGSIKEQAETQKDEPQIVTTPPILEEAKQE